MKVRLRVVLAVVALLAAGAAVWRWQTTASSQVGLPVDIVSQAGNPIEVVSTQCSTPTQPPSGSVARSLVCEAKLKSTGNKLLRAVAVEWTSFDNAGAAMLHSTSFSDYGFPLPTSRGSVTPGQEFSEGGKASPSAKKLGVRVVFVEFADGSTWGDVRDRTFSQIIGARAGAQQVIEYLKLAKQTMGADQALQQLGIK